MIDDPSSLSVQEYEDLIRELTEAKEELTRRLEEQTRSAQGLHTQVLLFSNMDTDTEMVAEAGREALKEAQEQCEAQRHQLARLKTESDNLANSQEKLLNSGSSPDFHAVLNENKLLEAEHHNVTVKVSELQHEMQLLQVPGSRGSLFPPPTAALEPPGSGSLSAQLEDLLGSMREEQRQLRDQKRRISDHRREVIRATKYVMSPTPEVRPVQIEGDGQVCQLIAQKQELEQDCARREAQWRAEFEKLRQRPPKVQVQVIDAEAGPRINDLESLIKQKNAELSELQRQVDEFECTVKRETVYVQRDCLVEMPVVDFGDPSSEEEHRLSAKLQAVEMQLETSRAQVRERAHCLQELQRDPSAFPRQHWPPLPLSSASPLTLTPLMAPPALAAGRLPPTSEHLPPYPCRIPPSTGSLPPYACEVPPSAGRLPPTSRAWLNSPRMQGGPLGTSVPQSSGFVSKAFGITDRTPRSSW